MNSILLIGFVIDKTKYVCIETYKKYEILGYCLLDYKSSKTKYVTRKGLSDWFNSPEFSTLNNPAKGKDLLGFTDILDYKYVAHEQYFRYSTLLKTVYDIDFKYIKGYESHDDAKLAKINLFDIAGGIFVNYNNIFCLAGINFNIFNMNLRLYAYYDLESGEKFLSTSKFCEPAFYLDSTGRSGCYDTLCEIGLTGAFEKPCDEMVVFTLEYSTLECYTLVFVGEIDTLVLDKKITKYSIVAKANMLLTVVLHDRLEYLDLDGCYNCTLVSSRYFNLRVLAGVIYDEYLYKLVISSKANGIYDKDIFEKNKAMERFM